MNPHEELFKHIRRFTNLAPEKEELLISKLKYRKINHKDFLLREFQVCDGYYFVLTGCLRFYRNTESGFEQILQFAIPNWWLSDYRSFETLQVSEYNIQAVHDTGFLTLLRPDYEELFNTVPELN